MAKAHEADEQPAGSLVPREQQPQELPERFTIGTKRAYRKGYEYSNKKQRIGEETVYLCTTGSEYSCKDEVLVLRREKNAWIAYDSSVTGNELTCRQKVFRSRDAKITKQGYHEWEMNKSANKGPQVHEPEWFGSLWCITKVTES